MNMCDAVQEIINSVFREVGDKNSEDVNVALSKVTQNN